MAGCAPVRLQRRCRENLEAMAVAMQVQGVPGVWVLPASNLGAAPQVSESGAALAHFERGLSLREAGDRAGALAALRRARDGDQLPRRATSELVRIMARHQVPVVDAEAVLLKRDLGRTPSGGFSIDRMHLTAAGYLLVMAEVYRVLGRTVHLRPMAEIAHRLPHPGASLAPVLGPIERTVAAPTLGELEHKSD